MDDHQLDVLVTAILASGERARSGPHDGHSISATFENVWRDLADQKIVGPDSRYRRPKHLRPPS
jgi:hypothetical protein